MKVSRKFILHMLACVCVSIHTYTYIFTYIYISIYTRAVGI